MNWNLLGSVLVMIVASYLPRFIPLVFCRKKVKSVFLRSFLFYMPYAVLAGLTFPAIFYATDNVIVSAIGTAVALILSFFRCNMALVAVICVALVFGLSYVL